MAAFVDGVGLHSSGRYKVQLYLTAATGSSHHDSFFANENARRFILHFSQG